MNDGEGSHVLCDREGNHALCDGEGSHALCDGYCFVGATRVTVFVLCALRR